MLGDGVVFVVAIIGITVPNESFSHLVSTALCGWCKCVGVRHWEPLSTIVPLNTVRCSGHINTVIVCGTVWECVVRAHSNQKCLFTTTRGLFRSHLPYHDWWFRDVCILFVLLILHWKFKDRALYHSLSVACSHIHRTQSTLIFWAHLVRSIALMCSVCVPAIFFPFNLSFRILAKREKLL